MIKGKKIVAIIQARMGSTRLPGKVLRPLLGKPMLQCMIERVKLAKFIDQIVVATTTNPKDNSIIKLCRKLNVLYFRGSETDVLDRYYQTAQKFNANIIVRLTADCPLIDPQFIDITIKQLHLTQADYSSLRTPITLLPSGFDVEAFTFSAFAKVHSQANSAYDREHVTPYFYHHPNLFQLTQPHISLELRHPSLHLSVDTMKDLKKIRRIYASFYPRQPQFSLNNIIELFKTRL